MNEDQVAALVARLGTDADFLDRVRGDATTVMNSFDLTSTTRRTILHNRIDDLRALIGVDDVGALLAAGYTSGGKCSTACSTAGCYTEGKCPSNYGCSGNPPKC